MRCLGGGPEVSQLAVTAKPYRTAIQRSSVMVRHPSLSKHPARLFTNATKHDFQSGREMVGCGHLHRDCMQQAELFFTLVVPFCGSGIHYYLPIGLKLSNSTGTSSISEPP